MNNFCMKCGFRLNEDGICPRCGTAAETPKETRTEFCPDCGVPFNENGICPRCGNRLVDMEQRENPVVNMIYSDEGSNSYEGEYYTEPKKKKSGFGLVLLLLLLIAVIGAGVFLFADKIPELFAPKKEETESEIVLPDADSPDAPPVASDVTEDTEWVPEGNYPPEFAYFTASSAYDKDEHNTSKPEDAFDGTVSTCWQDGADGYGEGETLTAHAYEDQLIYSITVYNGYQKPSQSSKYYKYNSRVKEIIVHYEGGSMEFTLEDIKSPQTFEFPEPITTDFMKIEIKSVYKGDKYKDTCISDIIFE